MFSKERGTKVKKQSSLSRLLEFSGGYRKLTFLGLFLSGVAMIMGMVPYICVWLPACSETGWTVQQLKRLTEGKTVIMIAHRMRTVEKADKVVVLKDGHVAEEGNPEELKKERNSIFGHMLELQTLGAQWSI